MKSFKDSAKLEQDLARILSTYDLRPDTNGIRFALASPSRKWKWEWASPNSLAQYFIASTTKLYINAIVMQLRNEGLVDLDTPASKYLGPTIMKDIHILNGAEWSDRISVRHLLAHTSGIADYFEQKRDDGVTTFKRFLAQDFSWTLTDILEITKKHMKPKFPPGTPNKAHYSDTNYQLLGVLIENLTGLSLVDALHQRIFQPLELKDTYMFTADTLDRYDEVAAMLYGRERVRIPKAMASVGPDGGIVSTAAEGITFLKAFMTGVLFPRQYLDEMQRNWNRVFFPLEYGVGIMRYALPRIFSPFHPSPPMAGHSGASGAVLYYVPKLDLYLSGTINQTANRALPYQLMSRLALACDLVWKDQL